MKSEYDCLILSAPKFLYHIYLILCSMNLYIRIYVSVFNAYISKTGSAKSRKQFPEGKVVFYTSIGSIGITNGSEVCVCMCWGRGKFWKAHANRRNCLSVWNPLTNIDPVVGRMHIYVMWIQKRHCRYADRAFLFLFFYEHTLYTVPEDIHNFCQSSNRCKYWLVIK